MERTKTALEDKSDQIFEVLKGLPKGEWHSRKELAQELSKKRLSNVEVAALDRLVEAGVIKAERHEINANIRERWEYKVI